MYDFTKEQVAKWKDYPRYYKGANDTAIVFVHGWSTMPRCLVPMAKIFHKAGYWASIPLLKGHGSKPEDLENVKWEEWLENVIESINSLKKNKAIKRIFIVGSSAGGNLAILANLKTKVDGIVFIGTPVHLKNHFWIWLGAKIFPFLQKRYVKKFYQPADTKNSRTTINNSYNYIPVKSVRENFKLIKKSVVALNKTETPALILQTNNDYLVTKYSPWIIYNKITSDKKRIQWMKSKYDSHVPLPEENQDYFEAIDNFIKETRET